MVAAVRSLALMTRWPILVGLGIISLLLVPINTRWFESNFGVKPLRILIIYVPNTIPF